MISDLPSPAQHDAAVALLVRWTDLVAVENPIVTNIDRDADVDRWYVRIRGEEKIVTTVWFTIRERTLSFESYFLPAPEDNAAQFYEYLLRANTRLYGMRFSIGLEDLVTEFGPAALTPPSALEVAEYEAAKERGEQVYAPQPMRFDRAAAERRLRSAERDLATLGKVNPLALEEFAALEERHAFLSTQLTDLKDTRRDLMTVIGDVDEKIQEVFTSAFHDVAREFVTVFETLFPGGEGSLVLTDPDDMLTTGIEVNARPPGKKVKRLSLLSGGERSLTAVAILVAIFRARPSPFYVMDEVEAALDEVNLTRLVRLLSELRESSQLIIITHQKSTMEAADALYGVSMRGDGITQVISQRIRGVALVPATA